MADNEAGYNRMKHYREIIQKALDERDFPRVAMAVASAEADGYIPNLLLESIVQMPNVEGGFVSVDATMYCAGVEGSCN